MANITITQLPTASALTGSELVPVVQSGVTVQTTTGAISGAGALNYPFLTVGSTSGLTQARYLNASTGLSLTDSGAGGTLTINMTGAASSLNAASTGFIVKDGASTVVNRSLTVGSGMTVSNADGVSGNPVIGLSQLLQNISSTTAVGLLTVNGNTVTATTIVGTTDQISVATGNGIGGSPTIGIASNPIVPGTAAITLPSGTTAQRAGSNGALRYNTTTATFEGYANGAWGSITTGTGVTSIATGTGLTGGPITSTGTISIANTAVSAGSYGSASSVGTFTVNAQGQLTLATDVAISIPASAINTTIPNSGLANSSITLGTTNIALGATSLTPAGLTSVTVTQDPTNAFDLATKQYVDGLVSTGLAYHQPAQVATTQSLAAQTGGTVTYNNGASGVGATLTLSVALTTLDGYSLSNGDRIMVKNEVNQANNGVYTWATGGTVLTRSTDTNTYGPGTTQLSEGDYFFIQNGTVNKGDSYVCSTIGVITFGTTAITFSQFSTSQVYTAGTGLTLTGTQFSISNTAVSATSYGSASQVATFTVNAQGQLTSASNTTIAIANTQVSGLGTMSTQNANSVAITGGAIDGATIGATTASTVKATTVTTTGTGSPADGAGQVYLNGLTSNRVEWSAVGTGAPAFTTRSAGTKLLLYPALSGSQVDYAMGIDSATLWSSVPVASSSFFFKWYGGQTEVASMDGTGAFTATSFAGAGTGLTGTASSLSIGGNAATATNATNTAITANSTNADYYITVVSANTGNLPQLVATGLTANPSTGKITSGVSGGTF